MARNKPNLGRIPIPRPGWEIKAKTEYNRSINKKISYEELCTCGNLHTGYQCVCEHIAEFPGNNLYKCNICGMYESSIPRCRNCKCIYEDI